MINSNFYFRGKIKFEISYFFKLLTSPEKKKNSGLEPCHGWKIFEISTFSPRIILLLEGLLIFGSFRKGWKDAKLSLWAIPGTKIFQQYWSSVNQTANQTRVETFKSRSQLKIAIFSPLLSPRPVGHSIFHFGLFFRVLN